MPKVLEQLVEARGLRASTPEAEVTALISQMQAARGDVEQALVKLGKLADSVRAKTAKLNESSRYRLYSNEHLRFTGAAIQGLKRTVGSDRILDRIKAAGDQDRYWEERQKRWESERLARFQVAESVLPPDDADAFDDVYKEVIDG